MDTPNTVNYLVAGYTVFSLVFFSYVLSLFLRWRNLKRDLQILQEIEKK